MLTFKQRIKASTVKLLADVPEEKRDGSSVSSPRLVIMSFVLTEG